jgi:iron complex transport system substrate-binding protein
VSRLRTAFRGTSLGILCTVTLLLTNIAASPARDFQDDAGRVVAVPERVERVFAAGPPAAILLYTLAPDTMLGWPRANSKAEAAFMPGRYATLPELGRLTGRGDTANVEVVLATQPDILFDYGTIDPTYMSLADRVQQQIRLPYLLIDGRFDRIPQAYRTLGELLGLKGRAEEFAGYAETTLSEARRIASSVPADRRPRVYYARGPEGLETGLSGSINVELLDWVGAENVAKSAGAGGLATVSIEQVLQWDPDVILTLDAGFFERVKSDPRWKDLRAVRDGRVYLGPALPFGWFDRPPSVNRLIGVRWLLSILYPDRAPGDLREETHKFYTLFYHQEPSPAQLDQLLGAALPK